MPIPRGRSYAEINAWLMDRCIEDAKKRPHPTIEGKTVFPGALGWPEPGRDPGTETKSLQARKSLRWPFSVARLCDPPMEPGGRLFEIFELPGLFLPGEWQGRQTSQPIDGHVFRLPALENVLDNSR